MRRFIYSISFLLCSFTTITHASESAYPPIISEEQATPSAELVESYVLAWINCIECTDGELRRVIENGTQARSTLEAIVDGDPAYFPNRDAEFSAQWARLSSYIATTGIGDAIPQETFVGAQRAAIRNTYIARAQKAIDLLTGH